MRTNPASVTALGECELCPEPATRMSDDYALCEACADPATVPVIERPCKGCGFVLRYAPLGTGVVQDTSMRGVPGGPFPEFVPGDRMYCLRCITGVEATDD